ncbi:MAG TPA: KEOPS complex subunit Cgi121 [Thermoplasmata archaeon]|jgi:tRNA threonylcarbamoyladenosine modification (KEOPS) complex Cgi121 subunit
MEDEVAHHTEGFGAWIASIPKGSAPAFLKECTRRGAEIGAVVVVLRADMVFGAAHLRSALYHAKKSVDEGRNSSDSLAMETLLYSSGERQLSAAIRKMTADAETDEVVVAILGRPSISPHKDWRNLPEMREDMPESSLAKFGFTDQEIATLTRKRALELVLERVAAVDVLKK